MRSSWQMKSNEWFKRGSDQYLRIAVTGLRRSGKTTFMTALVDALLHADASAFPLWQVAASGRLMGSKQAHYESLHIPTFPYAQQREMLSQGLWPQATETLNEIRLVIRYQPSGAIRQRLFHHRDLYLDLFDYPGEWLLDLPLLEQSFQQWSDSMQQAFALTPVPTQKLFNQLSQLDSARPANDYPLDAIAEDYQHYLIAARDVGGYWLQPGRFLLPGELKGAPVLAFFPWFGQPVKHPEQLSEDSCYRVLQRRYNYYRDQVVAPFYRDYFSRFDRQVVLVDVLDALNHGEGAILQMQKALCQALESFHYGRRHIFNRLFSPRIDRVVFAASQADRVTLDQYPALALLLDELLAPAVNRIRFSGTAYQTMVTSAVVATEQGRIHGQSALRGRDLSSGEMINVFPGGVPRSIPESSFWQQHHFDFPQFLPPSKPLNQLLPHMRMDALLEYLVGDKLS
ncbi:YcjX family GTP-binding protein [Celerinatantimonas yamalensis]|uniref:YcjX family protein n=1 Tax=Celerinatantimonas yamalensis TaxID=559956 RepID=A0ABW9G421_9GAMM